MMLHTALYNVHTSENVFTFLGKGCEILLSFEPRHDKANIMGLRPAWIQTSLRIRAV
jgi:hypothetical protein